MKKHLKGGIETIIAIVIIVGIVIALIVTAVLPLATGTTELSDTGKEGLQKLQGLME